MADIRVGNIVEAANGDHGKVTRIVGEYVYFRSERKRREDRAHVTNVEKIGEA